MDKIMRPTVRGLVADGIRYRGFLYAGVMIDAAGEPRVIEFNCRLGDPETQPIVARLRSDLVALCLASFDGTLGDRASTGIRRRRRRRDGERAVILAATRRAKSFAASRARAATV